MKFKMINYSNFLKTKMNNRVIVQARKTIKINSHKYNNRFIEIRLEIEPILKFIVIIF